MEAAPLLLVDERGAAQVVTRHKQEFWLEPLFDEVIPEGAMVLVFAALPHGASVGSEPVWSIMTPSPENLKALYQYGAFDLKGIGLVVDLPADSWSYIRFVRVSIDLNANYPARLPFEAQAFEAQRFNRSGMGW